MRPLRVAFYSPSNLNVIDGSAIWVQSVAETLHAGPDVHVTLPQRFPEKRDLITRMLRRLERVELVEPTRFGHDATKGLNAAQVLEILRRLDEERPFDVVLLRTYELCLVAAAQPWLAGRLWSAYVLEPERDLDADAYRADLARIALASRHVLVQSEEMRALLELHVPEARGRTILLPPAIPSAAAPATDPGRIVERLIYTGKFSRFYPVPRLVAFFGLLRAEHPALEFHVAGDKIHRASVDPEYAAAVQAALTETAGLTWHGGLARDEVEALLAAGGVALSVWDRRHGERMNDLVISTKLLDYCAVGLPVVLSRTAAQEAMLGVDYPLFVSEVDEVLPLLRRLLGEPALYRAAAERCFAATRRFTYPAVFERLRPYLERATTPDPGPDPLQLDRPKLPGARWNLGLMGLEGLEDALVELERRRTIDDRYRLIVRAPSAPAATLPTGATFEAESDDGYASWLRKIGTVLGDLS